MFGIVLVIVIGTTIWVAYDSNANKVTIDNKPYSLNNGALAWFITCLLLWIVTFPYYLVKRSKTLQQRQGRNEKMATDTSSVAEEIKKYKRMLDEGIITQEDFEAKKKKLMGL